METPKRHDELDALLYGHILLTLKRNWHPGTHDGHAIPERCGHSYLHYRALDQAQSLLGHRTSHKGYHASADPLCLQATAELEYGKQS